MSTERPKLRDTLQAKIVEAGPGEKVAAMYDASGIIEEQIAVPPAMLAVLLMFDGVNTLEDVRREFKKRYGSELPRDKLLEIVKTLDENYFLESERFNGFLEGLKESYESAPYRKATHRGNAYPEDTLELRKLMDGFFGNDNGVGAPVRGCREETIGGLIVPHIDLEAGAVCYAPAYKALAEAQSPSLFVLLGTDHYGMNRFTATRKGYDTPFGPLETDTEFLEAVDSRLDFSIFENEFYHEREHSLEFQALWLRYLFPDEPLRIAPIICGSFADAVEEKKSPSELADVAAMCNALEETIAGSDEPVCIIAGADLAHVGTRFGREKPVTKDDLQEIGDKDTFMIKRIMSGDVEGFADLIIKEHDERNVCGFPPIYVMLKVLRASRAEGLQYGISYEKSAGSCVSFAAIAFY